MTHRKSDSDSAPLPDTPDGAWGGGRERDTEPTELREIESDPERATRLVEGLGPRLACRLSPRWLLRLLSARGAPRTAKVAALIDALHALPATLGAEHVDPARIRALDRQAVRVAAQRMKVGERSVASAPRDPLLMQSARRALRRIDPADLADSDLAEVRTLALTVGEHGLALLLWLEEVAAEPDHTARARRWIAHQLGLDDSELVAVGLSREVLEAALLTLSQHVPALAES